MRFRPSLAALVLVLSAPAAALSQASANVVARVDSVFTRWNTKETPGCAVGVAQDGKPTLQRAYGMADLERDIPANPNTIYEAGSVSKQFTATAIILLAQQGKLSLTDDVRKYVPELPDYGTPITIRHLINHTSGLRDWGSVAGIAGWGRSVRTHNHAHVIDILSRQRGLNFTPGDQYSYSNSGYNLQAVIVERVSGQSLAEFSKRFIFEPLGMRNTQWRDDYTRIVKGRSIAYTTRGSGFAIDHPIENVYGNGGLLTTVTDLLAWNENLNEGRWLGGKAYVDEMHRQGVLNNGSTIGYAGGLQVGNFRGVRSVSHTGSTSGYRAYLARFPEQKVSVAVLCNVGAVNPGGVGQQVAEVFLGNALQAAGRGRGAVSVDDSTAAPPARGVEPQRGRGAGAGGRGGAGAGAPTAGDLAAYAGEYFSPDAETTLIVSVEGTQLVARRRPATRIVFTPQERDVFGAGGGLGTVRFIRDASGKVTQLSVRQDRVFDLRFDRVK